MTGDDIAADGLRLLTQIYNKGGQVSVVWKRLSIRAEKLTGRALTGTDQAVAQLTPDALLVDAMTLDVDLPQESLIKGDARSVSIAAASVIAKETRDTMMEQYAVLYPEYGFDQHAGYGTAQHLQALDRVGVTPIHRKTFKPVLDRL